MYHAVHTCVIRLNSTIINTFFKKFLKKCCPYIDTLVSGSPIIQDGRLIGAVTHVLVNDPTTGYGIFIENMLNAADPA